MEKKLTKPSNNTINGAFGNTKGNTKPASNSMPQSGGPKTPPSPKGSRS